MVCPNGCCDDSSGLKTEYVLEPESRNGNGNKWFYRVKKREDYWKRRRKGTVTESRWKRTQKGFVCLHEGSVKVTEFRT